MAAYYPPIEIQTRALVFIVLEHDAFKAGKRQDEVGTDEVARHLGLEHKRSMKVIEVLRRREWISLRTRISAGYTGYGWGGSLFGALTPQETGIELVRKILERPSGNATP